MSLCRKGFENILRLDKLPATVLHEYCNSPLPIQTSFQSCWKKNFSDVSWYTAEYSLEMAASREGVIIISHVCAAPQSVLLFDYYFSMPFHEPQSFAWLLALLGQWWCLALGFDVYLHLNTSTSWITVSLLPRLSFGRNIC